MVSPTTVKTWAKRVGITGVGGMLLIMYLVSLNVIEVISYTPDIECAGTELRPCIINIELKALKNVSVSGKWSFTTDKHIKTYSMFVNGKNKTNSAFKFVEGKTYNVQFIVLKNNSWDTVKWTFGTIDPYLLPAATLSTSMVTNEKTVVERYVATYEKLNCTMVKEPMFVNPLMAGTQGVTCHYNTTPATCYIETIKWLPCVIENGTRETIKSISVQEVKPKIELTTLSFTPSPEQNCFENKDDVYCVSKLDGGRGNISSITPGMSYCYGFRETNGKVNMTCKGHSPRLLVNQKYTMVTR